MFAKTTTFNLIKAKRGKDIKSPNIVVYEIKILIKNCNFGFFSVLKKLAFASWSFIAYFTQQKKSRSKAMNG